MYDAEAMVDDAACAANALVGHTNGFAGAIPLCTSGFRVGDILTGFDVGEWNRLRRGCGSSNLGAISSAFQGPDLLLWWKGVLEVGATVGSGGIAVSVKHA